MDFANVQKFMDSLTAWRIPGNDISIYLDNKEVFRYQSGFSDLENGIKMGDNHLFYIYSCSKVATITAAMQLFEKGKFLLDDPIYEFIPEFRNMKIENENGELVLAKNPITMRHLFTMTAGISYEMTEDVRKRAWEISGGKMDTLTVVKCMGAGFTLSFEPGTHWQYSYCHDILAAVVEVISGMKFRDYMAKNIFEPLGMTDTYYHNNDSLTARLAPKYMFVENDNEGRNLVEMQKNGAKGSGGYAKRIDFANDLVFGSEYDSGGAGIITSVSDYVKFVNALANYGVSANGERILSKASVELIKTNQLSRELLLDFNWKQLNGYGYGLGVRTMIDKAAGGSLGSIGEFGWGGAAGATVLADTDKKLAVFYTHHMLNPQEDYYQPRLRNVIYSCLD